MQTVRIMSGVTDEMGRRDCQKIFVETFLAAFASELFIEKDAHKFVCGSNP